MTPDAAVRCLAEIIAKGGEYDELDLYNGMAEAGVPDEEADRAFKFTQIAWGRVFLDGLGIKFAPDYFCFDAHGDAIESGLLSSHPYFAIAMALAPQYAAAPGFARFAQMSGDVNAVNSALHNGSKPENLTLASPGLFMEAPTSDGLAKAREFLDDWAEKMPPP